MPARAEAGKPLAWLQSEINSPPFSPGARLEAGKLLRRLQRGDQLGLPHSRPMPVVGPRCHELRIVDVDKSWRIIYRLDPDAIVIASVFRKTTRATPARVIAEARKRLRLYDAIAR